LLDETSTLYFKLHLDILRSSIYGVNPNPQALPTQL
jgi:hypothetical protein